MLTRQDAIGVLYELINSGILAQNLEESLEDIVQCIQAEDRENNFGIDIWGAEENDWVDLYIAKGEDLITPEWIQHRKNIYEKYRIKGEHDHPPSEQSEDNLSEEGIHLLK